MKLNEVAIDINSLPPSKQIRLINSSFHKFFDIINPSQKVIGFTLRDYDVDNPKNNDISIYELIDGICQVITYLGEKNIILE